MIFGNLAFIRKRIVWTKSLCCIDRGHQGISQSSFRQCFYHQLTFQLIVIRYALPAESRSRPLSQFPSDHQIQIARSYCFKLKNKYAGYFQPPTSIIPTLSSSTPPSPHPLPLSLPLDPRPRPRNPPHTHHLQRPKSNPNPRPRPRRALANRRLPPRV